MPVPAGQSGCKSDDSSKPRAGQSVGHSGRQSGERGEQTGSGSDVLSVPEGGKQSANIHPTAIVSSGADIGEDVFIGPFCVVEDGVRIGARSRLDSHVVVKRYTTLGEDNHLHTGVLLGSDPEDRNFQGHPSYLSIGDRNVFREYSTASRGTPPESTTRIGSGNYIMIGTHVAHNCHLGDAIVVCNNCSLAGYVEVDDGAFLSGGVVVHQFSRIGRLVMIGGNTRVNRDVPPFLLTSDFNVAAHGLNLVGLRRAGFSRETISRLREAYRLLYRSGLALEEALGRITSEVPGEEAGQLVEFIRGSKRGICRDARARQRPSAAPGNSEHAAAGDAAADDAKEAT